MALRGWTSAVRQAWQWVKSGVARVLGREEAREQYVAGGGEIAEYEWEDAWTLGEQMYAQGRLIQDLPGEAIVSGFYFTPSPADYGGRFHMSAEVEYFNKDTQEWETKVVSTNADELLSLADWEGQMIKAIKDTEISPNIDWDQGVSFYNYQPELASWA